MIEFEAVKLLKPEPGEVIVVTLPEDIDAHYVTAAATALKGTFGDVAPVVMLDHDWELHVHRLDSLIALLEEVRDRRG